jgi:hypothetical protein
LPAPHPGRLGGAGLPPLHEPSFMVHELAALIDRSSPSQAHAGQAPSINCDCIPFPFPADSGERNG